MAAESAEQTAARFEERIKALEEEKSNWIAQRDKLEQDNRKLLKARSEKRRGVHQVNENENDNNKGKNEDNEDNEIEDDDDAQEDIDLDSSGKIIQKRGKKRFDPTRSAAALDLLNQYRRKELSMEDYKFAINSLNDGKENDREIKRHRRGGGRRGASLVRLICVVGVLCVGVCVLVSFFRFFYSFSFILF